MHARIMSVQVKTGKEDDLTNIYRDSVIPAANQQKGFKGGFLLFDPNTGKCVSITLWETEADMTAGEASGYLREQVAKLVPTFASPPVREGFEVRVQA